MRLPDVSFAMMNMPLDVLHNALAVLMALRILRLRIRPVLICFAAFSGAFFAFAASIAQLSRMQSMLLWLPSALFMMRIAAGRGQRAGKAIEHAAVLLACEGFLGGVVLALWGASGSLLLSHILSIGFAGAVFVSAGRAAADGRRVRRVRVICTVGEEQLAFDAIVDSGNTLRDYLTHRPVIVAGGEHGARLCQTRTRLIFADTAGGRQMMQLVIPKETMLEYSGGKVRAEAALAFTPALGREALVPASLLE